MNRVNFRAVCRELGIYENALSQMKKTNPEKFHYIQNLDDDLVIAYRKYEAQKIELLQQIAHMYYSLSDKRRLTKFSRFLFYRGLFTNSLSFVASVTGVLFKAIEKMDHLTFVRYSKIIDLYKEFE